MNKNRDFLQEKHLAVIIPTFNDNQRLDLCLKALSEQSLNHNNFKIYVVDNGSQKSPDNIVDKYENAHLLYEEKPGSYNARNKALETIEADYYAFTDSDCIPDPKWLESGINLLKNDDVDATGGPIVLFPEKKEQPNAIELIDMLSGFQQKESVLSKHYTPTANLITQKSTIEKVGLFNGQLMSGGDKDWCLRLHKIGGNLVYAKNSIIYHPARASKNEYYTKTRRLAHGMWARRESDSQIQQYLGFKGIISCIIPPVTRWKKIFNQNKKVKFTTKVFACLYIYNAKLYTLYELFRCYFGLVKSAERK